MSTDDMSSERLLNPGEVRAAEREPTIFLIGGGFSDGEFLELDLLPLEAVARPTPRVCFIPTASGDSRGYIERFYNAFGRLDCEATHLELFRRSVGDLDAFVSEQDVLYVGGGNTANLLSIWRLHGLDKAVENAYRSGTVLAGISAGSACWFESYMTDSFGPLAALGDGLGFLPGSFCPHYNSEPERPAAFSGAIHRGELPAGYGLDDGAAAEFVNGRLEAVHRCEPTADMHPVP